MKRDVYVVGSGLGGLAAAIDLAARGWTVDVLESAPTLGGKASRALVDGLACDTGPTVLTLPVVFDGLFRLAGTTLANELSLRPLSPSFRYLFADGTTLDLGATRDATLASVEASLGRDARDELAAFLTYAESIWTAAAPHFVYGDAPSFDVLSQWGQTLPAMLRTDPARTMLGAIQRLVKHPALRTVLMRYAAYNGSDVRRAPATMNCIAHVELTLGAFGIEGGLGALVDALVRVGTSLGVRYRPSTPVASIEVRDDDDGVPRVRGVLLDDGAFLEARAVVANGEASHVLRSLVSAAAPKAAKTRPSRSMSAWTGIVRATRQPRAAHTVLLPPGPDEELADLFDRHRLPSEPSIYVCAPSVAHGEAGWPEHEPLFVQVNAPPLRHEPRPGEAPDSDELAALDRVQRYVLGALRRQGLVAEDDALVWHRSPRDLALRHPGTHGSIYGAASNDLLAAFRRPPNRVRGIRHLYLASGSAHPGGGVPMAALSGVHAARALAEDLLLV